MGHFKFVPFFIWHLDYFGNGLAVYQCLERECLYCSIYCARRHQQKKVPNGGKKTRPYFSPTKRTKFAKRGQKTLHMIIILKQLNYFLSATFGAFGQERSWTQFFLAARPFGNFMAKNANSSFYFPQKLLIHF